MLCATVLVFFIILLRRHTEIEQSAREALSFAATSLIPALFPFAVLSRLVLTAELIPCRGKVSTWLAGRLHLAPPLLAAYCLGLFCGFPIGAYAAASLYEAGLCRKAAAHRSASLANNASIAFLFSSAALFPNANAPVILFVSQTAATLLVSLFSPADNEPPMLPTDEPPSYLALAADAIGKAALAMLTLSAFVVFFAVFTKALLLLGLPAWIALFSEPASAVRYAASLAPKIGLSLSLSLAAFSLGFSGISVITQTQALFKGELPLAKQLLCRAQIALVSFAITFLLATLCLRS